MLTILGCKRGKWDKRDVVSETRIVTKFFFRKRKKKQKVVAEYASKRIILYYQV